MSASIHSVCPLEAAQWIAVKPSLWIFITIKIYLIVLVIRKNYLSELSTRAPAFIKANTAFAEPADAAHNSGGRPSLSIISTLEPGWFIKIFKIWKNKFVWLICCLLLCENN